MIRKFNHNEIKIKPHRIPNRRWFKRPSDYAGNSALVAEPGVYVPRVYRDDIVDCRVLWQSEKYFDDQGRVRVDLALSLCVGAIDGVIRIEAGGIPIYNYLGLDDVVTGHNYYKSLEVLTGEFDQSQSPTMLTKLGSGEAPYYPGLAYFVLKGWKLWKWGNVPPHFRAVVLRNIADVDDDTYADEPTFYLPPSAWAVTSIAGNFDDVPGKIYVTASGIQVYEVDLATNVWTVISNSGNFENDIVKDFYALEWWNGNLYCVTRAGLFRYNGTPLNWTTIFSYKATYGGLRSQGHITSNDNFLAWVGGNLAFHTEVYTYDGDNTIITGFNRLDGYNNHGGIAIDPITQDIYILVYKSLNDSNISKYDYSLGIWTRGRDVQEIASSTKNLIRKAGRCWHSQYSSTIFDLLWMSDSEWVPFSSMPGDGDNYLIYDDTTYRVNTCEFFSNRWHVTRSEIGSTQFLYRLETDLTTVTAMPAPAESAAFYTHMVKKVNNRLFVGCSRGFWEAGDA